ncbi:ribbon-helix-helix protein, CopG family [Synechococcus sp. AH-736-A19]|nr:ribbon-helix-helix protein, CopG family [Synechococcus sp. AH-736-A19]
MTEPLPILAKRNVKLQCDVDRAMAARVDATARKYDVPRAAVIRAALEQALPKA